MNIKEIEQGMRFADENGSVREVVAMDHDTLQVLYRHVEDGNVSGKAKKQTGMMGSNSFDWFARWCKRDVTEDYSYGSLTRNGEKNVFA